MSAATLLSPIALPLVRRAAAGYHVGPHPDDAARAASVLAGRGLACSVAYWDRPGEPAAPAVAAGLSALEVVAALTPPAARSSTVSVKLPALDRQGLERLAARALTLDVPLHFDALAPDTADATIRTALRLAASGVRVGCTLPGRWRRSLRDAELVAGRIERVRLVKGQWADPADPRRDPGVGLLALAERLADRVPAVAVASHDPATAESAVRRVGDRGGRAELELLYGLPLRRPLVELANGHREPPRVYLPFGAAYLPYALRKAATRPRVALWMLRDLLRGGAWGAELGRAG